MLPHPTVSLCCVWSGLLCEPMWCKTPGFLAGWGVGGGELIRVPLVLGFLSLLKMEIILPSIPCDQDEARTVERLQCCGNT